jgi:hypothetical protein
MPPAGTRYWPTTAIERYKLLAQESGWKNLAGASGPVVLVSRTRSGSEKAAASSATSMSDEDDGSSPQQQ